MSLSPTLIDLVRNHGIENDDLAESGAQTIAWGSLYICGLIPNALMNTLQQLFFLRVDPFGDAFTPHEEMRTFLRALLAAQTAQMVAYPFLFWVDLIPNFGNTPHRNP